MTMMAWFVLTLVVTLAMLIGFVLTWLCIHDYREHDGWNYQPTHRVE